MEKFPPPGGGDRQTSACGFEDRGFFLSHNVSRSNVRAVKPPSLTDHVEWMSCHKYQGAERGTLEGRARVLGTGRPRAGAGEGSGAGRGSERGSRLAKVARALARGGAGEARPRREAERGLSGQKPQRGAREARGEEEGGRGGWRPTLQGAPGACRSCRLVLRRPRRLGGRGSGRRRSRGGLGRLAERSWTRLGTHWSRRRGERALGVSFT